MSTRHVMSRKEFLHGLFRSRTQDDATARQEASPDASSEPDYLSMLPPEFSGAMLDMEAARLGGDVTGMSQNEKAALVVRAIYGKDALNA
ncbi:hypothetical protein [uncultured Mailhella sp.]|uniref:hypothetical protein n=1 Tax=uncultured Mailhella sp. TaxID=1981031 RepID=UPI0025FE058D|nr:hypothetical protein [uncultured Mailhella sp.]